MEDETIIEAWHISRNGQKGVQRVERNTNHTLFTPIDILLVPATSEQKMLFYTFLMEQIGKPYDFRSVFRFLSRTAARKNGKWFCSELVTAALNYAGIHPLARVEPENVSPGMLALSPILKTRDLS